MKIKTSELIDHALDWAVAEAQGISRVTEAGFYTEYANPNVTGAKPVLLPFPRCYSPSTRWAQGGPIIEREIGNLWKHNKLDPSEPDVWTAAAYCKAPDGTMLYYEDGPTPLIAAMRCFVSSKLGDEVEVPLELLS